MAEQHVSKKGREHKTKIMDVVLDLLREHTTVFSVLCNNIGSHHMQMIRKTLRGYGTLLMGKNTLIRKAIKDNLEDNPEWESLLPLLKGNVGLVFTNGDILEVKEVLMTSRVPAAAKTGMIAPLDVWIPKGPTGLEPTKTSVLQALGINSKINRGQIEILQNVHLIPAGSKVNASQANFLIIMGIRPFSYGLECVAVYDAGNIYDASLLNTTMDDVMKEFATGVANVAALSLQSGVATVAAFPHAVMDAYKNLLAIALETDYTFAQAQELIAAIESGNIGGGNTEAAVEEEPEPEPEPEEPSSSSGGGMGMFGGSDSY